MQPFFSIITVCLNAGEDLDKTVKSILNQNFQSFNIIIKDGLSSDGSFDQVLDNSKILKVQKKDSGIYDAMNQALEITSGKYVLFLNAGDILVDTTALSSFYENIIREDFPDLVYCDYKTSELNSYVQSPPVLSSFFLFRNMLCHQVCMFKKECFDKLGNLDINWKVEADYDFLIRLIILNKARYYHIQKLCIVSKSKGFSFQNNDLAKKEAINIRKKYYSHKYHLYNFLLTLTFPSLRMAVAKKSGILARLYLKVVNYINRNY